MIHFGPNIRRSLGIGEKKGTRTSKELEQTRKIETGLPDPPKPGRSGGRWRSTHVACAADITRIPSTAHTVEVAFNMNQAQFLQLVSRVGTTLEFLDICPGDADDECALPVLNLADAKVAFPKLRVLKIEGHCFEAVHLTCKAFPKLEMLYWNERSCGRLAYWHTDLPELQTVSISFIELDDASGWAASLQRSPKLQHFVAYKFWGLATYDAAQPHQLMLPSCTHLVLYRSDDLDYLSMWAPSLKELNLRACYNVQKIDIWDSPRTTEGKTLAANTNKSKPTGTSKFRLVAVNASVAIRQTQASKHARCAKVLYDDDDSGMGNAEQEERMRQERWHGLPHHSPQRPPPGSYVHLFVERDMFGFITGRTDENTKKFDGNGGYHIDLDHTKVYGKTLVDISAKGLRPGQEGLADWRMWSMDRSQKTIQDFISTTLSTPGDDNEDGSEMVVDGEANNNLKRSKLRSMKVKPKPKAVRKQQQRAVMKRPAKVEGTQKTTVKKACMKKKKA